MLDPFIFLCLIFFLIFDMEGTVLGPVLFGGGVPRIPSGTITDGDWEKEGTQMNFNQDKIIFCVGLLLILNTVFFGENIF